MKNNAPAAATAAMPAAQRKIFVFNGIALGEAILSNSPAPSSERSHPPAVAVIIAAKADDKAETVYEVADLCYHVMVMMVEMGISVEDIRKELASRHVIDHKVKQEKMTGNAK